MHAVNLLANERGIPEFFPGSGLSFIGHHATRDIVLDFDIEMELHIRGSLGVSIGTMKKTAPAHVLKGILLYERLVERVRF